MDGWLPSILRAIPLCIVWIGCSVVAALHVFDNSEHPIVFVQRSERFPVAPDAETSFVMDFPLRASTRGCDVVYETSSLPSEYVRTGSFRAHIQVQIEADGALYVLKSDERPPVNPDPRLQPPGYPVAPVVESGCELEDVQPKETTAPSS